MVGAVIALLLAGLGAAWMWLALQTQQPPLHLIVALAFIVCSAMFCARCVSHLLATLTRETAAMGTEDAADPRLSMLRDDTGRATRAARESVCPWCAAPLRPKATHCSACYQAL